MEKRYAPTPRGARIRRLSARRHADVARLRDALQAARPVSFADVNRTLINAPLQTAGTTFRADQGAMRLALRAGLPPRTPKMALQAACINFLEHPLERRTPCRQGALGHSTWSVYHVSAEEQNAGVIEDAES